MDKHSVSIKYTALIVAVLWLAACVCAEQPGAVALLESNPGTSLHAVNDSHLALAFAKAPFVDDTVYAVRWFENSIEITTYQGLSIPKMLDTLVEYQSHDSTQDAVAAVFIAVAKSRGHRVSIYQAKTNAAIVGCVKQRPAPHSLLRADIDPTLVEYDSEGNMISALVRIHRFDANMVTQNHFVISKIYLGSLIHTIQTQLGGRQSISRQLIRTI